MIIEFNDNETVNIYGATLSERVANYVRECLPALVEDITKDVEINNDLSKVSARAMNDMHAVVAFYKIAATYGKGTMEDAEYIKVLTFQKINETIDKYNHTRKNSYQVKRYQFMKLN
jgi:hypothetical protein